MLQDWNRAVRGLAKNPRFTLVSVATLALGIGACAAIFSVVHGVLLRPLPYPDADEIVAVWQVSDEGGRHGFSNPNFEDLRDQSRSLRFFAQYSSWVVSVAGGSAPVRARVARVSRELFDVLGVAPRRGRLFVAEELHEGAQPVAVISYGYWRRYLHENPDLSASRLRFNRRIHQVVGVMPPGFDFPSGTDVWVPREQFPRLPSRTAHNWRAVGRLEEGVSIEGARAELSAIARRLKRRHGDDTWMADATVVPLHEDLVGHVRRALLVLLGAVGFLLLVACANVVNLMLARTASRRKELVLCAALGASRWRLARQFLSESLILSFAGGVLGILLAIAGVRVLLALDPGRLPRAEEVSVSVPVLLFALAVSVATAMGLGLAAALRTARRDLSREIRESERSRMGGSSGRRLRNALVVGQVGMTLVLLLGAGLLARSLLRLLDVDPGFQVGDRLVMEASFPPPRDDEERSALRRAQRDLLARLRSMPGVVGAGIVDRLPMATGLRDGLFAIMNPGESVPDFEEFGRLMKDPSRVGHAEYRAATEGYFETMGIPLVRGRRFDEGDDPDAPHVALVSASLAEAEFPDREPIGQLIEFGNMDGDLRLLTVVGIVGDVHHRGLDAPVRPTLYTHARQRPPSTFTTVMEVTIEPSSVIASAREILSEIAPEVPPRFRTMEDTVAASFADRRFNLVVVSAFAGAALLLASIGIYGVTSYAVSHRTQEIGLRMALGARPKDVLRMIVGQGVVLIAGGVLMGIAGALLMSRALASLLFEVSSTDPMAFAAAALALAVVGLFACLGPARLATRVDPLVALRHE